MTPGTPRCSSSGSGATRELRTSSRPWRRSWSSSPGGLRRSACGAPRTGSAGPSSSRRGQPQSVVAFRTRNPRRAFPGGLPVAGSAFRQRLARRRVVDGSLDRPQPGVRGLYNQRQDFDFLWYAAEDCGLLAAPLLGTSVTGSVLDTNQSPGGFRRRRTERPVEGVESIVLRDPQYRPRSWRVSRPRSCMPPPKRRGSIGNGDFLDLQPPRPHRLLPYSWQLVANLAVKNCLARS
jgi:hypothetical protein